MAVYIKAKVKETGEVVLLRQPYRDEFTCFEPDFVQIDEDYNTIKNNGRYGCVVYDSNELTDIDFHYDPNAVVVNPVEDLKKQIRDIVGKDYLDDKSSRYEYIKESRPYQLNGTYYSVDDMVLFCDELLNKLNEIRLLVQ